LLYAIKNVSKLYFLKNQKTKRKPKTFFEFHTSNIYGLSYAFYYHKRQLNNLLLKMNMVKFD
jgi:hypothetical protein